MSYIGRKSMQGLRMRWLPKFAIVRIRFYRPDALLFKNRSTYSAYKSFNSKDARKELYSLIKNGLMNRKSTMFCGLHQDNIFNFDKTDFRIDIGKDQYVIAKLL